MKIQIKIQWQDQFKIPVSQILNFLQVHIHIFVMYFNKFLESKLQLTIVHNIQWTKIMNRLWLFIYTKTSKTSQNKSFINIENLKRDKNWLD